MSSKKKVDRAGSAEAKRFLEALSGGPLTLGKFLQSIRLGEEESLEAFAKRLGITRAKLCDIEQGRRGMSIERAAEWAKLLGFAEWQLVQLALQDEVNSAGLKLKVSINAA